MSQTISMSRLYAKYKSRIVRLMEQIAEALREEGFYSEGPDEFTDEEYSWWLVGATEQDKIEDEDDAFDIRLTIVESVYNDGEDPFGINFSLAVTARGGRIIGGLTPYNYSDRVWVSRKDPEAVEERWRLFEGACDPGEIVASIKSHYGQRD